MNMKTRKIFNITSIILILCLAFGIGAFFYNSLTRYKSRSNMTFLPLQFNPDDSSSVYHTSAIKVTVKGGFVKGLLKGKSNAETIVIRALAPLPSLNVEGANSASLSVQIENLNPDFYAQCLNGAPSSGNKTTSDPLKLTKLTANTLQLDIPIKAGEIRQISPVQPGPGDAGKYNYWIMGDNRDGYDTFGQIIDRVNGSKPVFVINNGDLVFSGKPNQYRLFDQLAASISTTLCTTLGNHDIRGNNGRAIYTELYGPAYYSFDFAGSHFAFLDSSPGWAEKTAISEAQYTWLAKDLQSAQGQRIFVITHIPPHDPRAGVTANSIPNLVNQVQSGETWLERTLDNYTASKLMNHGFQDPAEADRFEKLMSQYHVDTVYLSHIHSYLEYTKDGVRYLISGGAGAELLTENSYYHYLIAKIGEINSVSMVELQSPANSSLQRYLATLKLFALALYRENPLAVVLIIIGATLLVLLLVLRIYFWKSRFFNTLGLWFLDTARYSARRFKELFKKQASPTDHP